MGKSNFKHGQIQVKTRASFDLNLPAFFIQMKKGKEQTTAIKLSFLVYLQNLAVFLKLKIDS